MVVSPLITSSPTIPGLVIVLSWSSTSRVSILTMYLPAAPALRIWSLGYRAIPPGPPSVSPQRQKKLVVLNLLIACLTDSAAIGAAPYPKNLTDDRSYSSKFGTFIISRYMIGAPKNCVIFSFWIIASTWFGTKSFMMTWVHPM